MTESIRSKLDVKSNEYKHALSVDSDEHDKSMTDFDPSRIPWAYDPKRSTVPSAWAYDRLLGSHLRRWEAQIRSELGRPANIVELGCGPGGVSLWFAEHGHDVIGVDAARKRIDVARQIADFREVEIKKAGGSLRYICNDFFQIRVPRFDVLITLKTLHHVPDTKQLLEKYLASMNPDGLVFILDQFGSSSFSGISSYLIRAVLPPGWFRSRWLGRQRRLLGAVVNTIRGKKNEGSQSFGRDRTV